jgi:hypothetical protein
MELVGFKKGIINLAHSPTIRGSDEGRLKAKPPEKT